MTLAAAGAIRRRHSPDDGIQWLLASSEALDVVHWAMLSVSYCHICMVIKIASESGVLFCIGNFVVINNLR